MAWTTPRTWVAGEVLTAALMNTHLRDQLATIGDAWPSFTPAIVGWTLNNGTLTGVMKQEGKHVRGSIVFTFGSSTAVSGNLRFTLPVTKASGQSTIGGCGLNDVAPGNRYWRYAWNSTSTEMQFSTEADVRVSGTVPFTWATGDTASIEFDYQAA